MADYMTETPTIDEVFSAGAYFSWDWPKCGFGQLSFSKELTENGVELTCMNECMNREAVRKLLHAFADFVADNVVLLENFSTEGEDSASEQQQDQS